MRVYRICDMCRCTHMVALVCDECMNKMDTDTIAVEFGYPHEMDSEFKHHFCSEKCLTEWLKRSYDERFARTKSIEAKYPDNKRYFAP